MTGVKGTISSEVVTTLKEHDLHDLCEAADQGIRAGGGFGWITPPERDVMERYWRGVLMVPERTLFIGRLDGTVAGAIQMVRPPRNVEAHAKSAHLTISFVAPWARGNGLARRMTLTAAYYAKTMGVKMLNLDVRETHHAAIHLYERLGFVRWGTHPHYAEVDGKTVAGHYFYRLLDETLPPLDDAP